MTMKWCISNERIRRAKLHSQPRTGAMLPLLAFVMVVLLVAAVFAIDVAYIHVTRSELRTATDAAARAAVESLGREQSQTAAIAAAIEVANQNRVAGVGLTLDPNDIVFGVAVPRSDGSISFQPGGGSARNPVNSVRVTGSRTSGSPNGPVGLLFAPIFGVSNFQPSQTAVASRADRDISLVLDVSGSMNSFNRIQGLRAALAVFLEELRRSRQDVRVSLTVYSTTSTRVLPLTDDLALISNTFNAIVPDGFTAIGDGLRDGLRSLRQDPGRRELAKRTILLMTDGNHNRGISPAIVAGECLDEGIEVHAVTFSQGANQALMRQVAQIANGQHHHAVSNEQLSTVFREIARQQRVLLIE